MTHRLRTTALDRGLLPVLVSLTWMGSNLHFLAFVPDTLKDSEFPSSPSHVPQIVFFNISSKATDEAGVFPDTDLGLQIICHFLLGPVWR